jgi:hypothetical protein
VVNILTLRVVPTPADAGPGFHVEIWIDGTELTSSTAGLGMDAYDVLIPEVRLEATAEPRRVPVARCTCGTYGCKKADVVVRLDGGLVRWDWVGPDLRHVFDASQYRAELARARSDLSWETPGRTAGRLVLERLDRSLLARHRIRYGSGANTRKTPSQFELCLIALDPAQPLERAYQVFVSVPWEGRTPEALAEAVLDLLHAPPSTWTARWHAVDRAAGPPAIAGPNWAPLSSSR